MVNKNWLIFSNAILWMAAGFNIARIGVRCALTTGHIWLWCIPVFAAFGTMFFRIISKNTRRIRAMESERAPLYRFLTLKGYLIIAFMMTLGFTCADWAGFQTDSSHSSTLALAQPWDLPVYGL